MSLETLKKRAKDTEMVKLERDRLKLKLDEILAVGEDFETLRAKAQLLNTIKHERDLYKEKYEELLGLECECDILKNQVTREVLPINGHRLVSVGFRWLSTSKPIRKELSWSSRFAIASALSSSRRRKSSS